MNHIKTILFLAVLSILFFSCSPKSGEIVVANYGDYEITLSEFEKAYSKNVGGDSIAIKSSIDDYKSFLDLYLNFKMKLRDAEIRDYENDPDLANELFTYKRKVGASYLIEKEIFEPGLKKLYNQRLNEIRVSHIMIRPEPSDSAAEALARKIIDSIKAGGNFENFAKRYSADNFSKDSGGDIYWITAGQVIRSFEQAAYSLKVGEIYAQPVKTQYGYHIVKITGRQKRINKVRASHILIKDTPGIDSTDTASAFYKISSLEERIKNGEDFAELAMKYSEDQGSGSKGGDLGFFERRNMVRPFDETVFKMKKGEYSAPVKSRFGYHLIHATDIDEVPAFDLEKTVLRDIYKRTRYDEDYSNFTDSLKKAYGFKLDSELLDEIKNFKDTVRFGENYWSSNLHNELGSKKLIVLNKKSFPVDSLIAFAMSDRSFQNKIAGSGNTIEKVADKYSEQVVLEENALVLDKINPEFARLMEDYKNGIYIFKLQEKEIWGRIKIDTVEVRKYYDQNKNQFAFGDRVEFDEILVKSDTLAQRLVSEVEDGADFSELAYEYTKRPAFKNKKGAHPLQDAGATELAEKAYSLNKPGDISGVFKVKDGWSVVRLKEKMPSRLKTFEEAKAEAASGYQEKFSKRLEKEYLERLQSLYKPEVNYEALQSAFMGKRN